MPQPPAVLFVCLGNICRSPLAEAAFRAAAEAAGLEVTVDSAGTGDWHAGEPPDPRAIAEALRHGVDIGGYRARQVRREDFGRFTHILAADSSNLAALRRLAPADHRAHLSLMFDLVPGKAGQDLADPWYGAAENFAATWTEVTAIARALQDHLTGRG